MTFPHLRDPTPWLPSLPFCPQRVAALKENVEKHSCLKGQEQLKQGPGFLLYPEGGTALIEREISKD